MSPEEYDAQVARADDAAKSLIAAAQRELALERSEVRFLRCDPGPAICRLAADLSARAFVVGSRGRGVVKRALLGSMSDHLVRNAPYSVIVTRG
jgi:nucleotide-binding universal stress UspA family protein